MARTVSVLMAALLLIPLCGCGSSNAWMQADKLFKEKKYAEAAEAYAEVAKKYPKRKESAFNRAAALFMAQDYDGAIRAFQALGKEVPPDLHEKCEFNTGNGYLGKSEKEKAIEHYKLALYLDHTDLNAKWNLELMQRKQQQEQQQQGKSEDKGKKDDEKQQDQQKKNQQKSQDQKQPEQDKQDQQKNEKEQPKDDQQQDKQNANAQQKPQPKPRDGEISKKDAERLLRALSAEDKELQKQLRKPQDDTYSGAPRGKDW